MQAVVAKKPTISVVIPAYNDGPRLDRMLKRLHEIRQREYNDLEIIVSMKESRDNTHQLATEFADVVVKSGGVSQSRNDGAKVAKGDIIVFLDADAVPSIGTISTIAQSVKEDMIGTCTAYPSKEGFRSTATVALQNAVRATGLIKGISNLLFVHRSLVKKKVEYDPAKNVGEHHDYISRVEKHAGGRFTYLRIPRGYEVAVDRYERVGYLKTFFFWCRWAVRTHVLRQKASDLERLYWSL